MEGDGGNGPLGGGRTGRREGVPGIVIAVGTRPGRSAPRRPRIEAFVWGGRLRRDPTLPYGRWKARD